MVIKALRWAEVIQEVSIDRKTRGPRTETQRSPEIRGQGNKEEPEKEELEQKGKPRDWFDALEVSEEHVSNADR